MCTTTRTADRSQNLMNAGDEWLALGSCNGGVVLCFVAVFVSRACAFNRAAAIKATAARRDSRDRTCTQRHWCVATRRRRAVLCCAAWCRGFLINKRRAAVVDCSIFAISRHGPGTLRPFARAFRNTRVCQRGRSRETGTSAMRCVFFYRGVEDWRPHSNTRQQFPCSIMCCFWCELAN